MDEDRHGVTAKYENWTASLPIRGAQKEKGNSKKPGSGR
jgi:hypothetical protein